MTMDMAMRSFVLAAALALFAAAALIGWSLVNGGLSWPTPERDTDPVSGGSITITDGSLRDEFGEPDRISGGPDLAARGPTGAVFGAGPRFDWSGPPDPGAGGADLPRTTPSERVEADCRMRGGASYGCRCLVRLARRDLTEAEFAFLSLAEEQTPRRDRLEASGLAAPGLNILAGKLVALNVEARRRCGAGLAF